MRPLQPVVSKGMTEFANGKGISGEVMIIDHHYFLFSASKRRWIGFTRAKAERFILRNA